MLEATFVGHQGWLLSSAATHILVDPLLTDGFGHGGLAGRVFPPRRIDYEAFPPIDAVILTHEHDDHFDIASLNLIDRRVPLYLSSRSSIAMYEFLAGMGFQTTAVGPEQELAIGDLQYRTFAADHLSSSGDEWDVLPYIVADDTQQGTFVSAVDVAMPAAMFAALAQSDERVGILCLANNVTNTRFTTRGAVPASTDDGDGDALARVFARRWARVADVCGPPVLTAVCGGGWSHPPDLSWVDGLAFAVDSAALCQRLASQCRGRFVAPRPGLSYRIEGAAIETRCSDYVEPLPPEAWPDRRFRTTAIPVAFDPACGRRRLSVNQRARLVQLLTDFARFLYGRPPFIGLHSLGRLDECQRTFAFVLRDDAARLVVEYRPHAADFRSVDDDEPFSNYVGGWECWASDLLALLEGEIGPTALCYTGRLRCWNHRPDHVRISPHELWLFAHPLHRPRLARQLYETVLADEPSQTPPIRGRS